MALRYNSSSCDLGQATQPEMMNCKRRVQAALTVRLPSELSYTGKDLSDLLRQAQCQWCR